MNGNQRTHGLGALSGFVRLGILLTCLSVDAAEYFVSTEGSNTHDGLHRATAFATVQHGVDTLAPGDTLTILPGEYFGSVRRDSLGGTGAVTTIRAAIPGTVVLRGDVPVRDFRKAEGRRMAYVADLSCTGAVVVVNEVDTLKILDRVPNLAELDFMPGVMHHDVETGKLYITTPDMSPPDRHRYTASLIGTHGLYLSHAQRVVIEGLAATGFNALGEVPGRDFTLSSVWGIFVANGRECVIRDCRAWLNGQGIGTSSQEETSGDNVIERCTAWANATRFGVGDRGGLTLIDPRRDTIRDSQAFLNGEYGINIRRGGPAELEERNKSLLLNNLAWGNLCDFKIKGGYSNRNEIVRCVGESWTLNGGGRALESLVGHGKVVWQRDTIMLGEETNLLAEAEFADPSNHDYRLQATSRFRGSAPGGKDRGPHPYAPDIFYVRPDGNDAADGLSVRDAWQTPARAARDLKAGDTLYLLPGIYEGDLTLAGTDAGTSGQDGSGAPDRLARPGAPLDEAMPLSIRGRGTEPVILRGTVTLSAVHADFQRLTFEGPVSLLPCPESPVVQASRPSPAPAASQTRVPSAARRPPRAAFSFSHCRFAAAPTCLQATGLDGLTLTHCAFSNFTAAAIALTDCTAVDLRGNRLDNATGVAVQLDRMESILHAGYNGYRDLERAWSLPDPKTPAALDPFSFDIAATGTGPFGRPVGPCRDERRGGTLALVERPTVRSSSATTANLEWMTSLPATCELAWGDTPDCANTRLLDVDRFGSFSLTGLEPGRTCYFTIRSLRTPSELLDEVGPTTVAVMIDPLVFTTPKESRTPVAYYVAPDGSDSNTGLERSGAWRTIQHAADTVNVGDTVLIAGGTYTERVHVRATGEAGAPITFKAMPGERVMLDGMKKTLNAFFIATGKKHLRFDGFRFVASNRERLQGWFPWRSGEIKLYDCEDVEITRCLGDGRGGYSASFIAAMQVDNLRIRNCAHLNKFSGMEFVRCPNLLIENSVFVRPMIASFLVRNEPDQPVIMNHNIFTDSLKKKAVANIPFMSAGGPTDALRQSNNCYQIRSFTPQDRLIMWKRTMGQLEALIREPLFADPGFAGDPNPADTTGFAPDRLTNPNLEIDFDSLFATNPAVVKRGIGLQPEAFKDFDFKLKGSSR